MSAFADENGIVPVRLTVKEFKDKENSLYALITLEKIETEIKDRGESFATTPTPYPVSEMSIPDIVSKIKPTDGNILKYLPDKLLNAEYLYSTQDKRGDTNIEAWDYFYVPIKIGDETAGVRIAIRAVSNPKGSQIYNWGIKNDTSLGGVGHTPFGSNSNGTSSDVSKANIPQNGNSINTLDAENSAAKAQQNSENAAKAQQRKPGTVSAEQMYGVKLSQENKNEDFAEWAEKEDAKKKKAAEKEATLAEKQKNADNSNLTNREMRLWSI